MVETGEDWWVIMMKHPPSEWVSQSQPRELMCCVLSWGSRHINGLRFHAPMFFDFCGATNIFVFATCASFAGFFVTRCGWIWPHNRYAFWMRNPGAYDQLVEIPWSASQPVTDWKSEPGLPKTRGGPHGKHWRIDFSISTRFGWLMGAKVG